MTTRLSTLSIYVFLCFAAGFAAATFTTIAAILPGCGGESSGVRDDGGTDDARATPDGAVSNAHTDGGGGPSDYDADIVPSCATYCMFVEGACSGEAAAYVSDDACRAICATWTLGAIEDSDDSVGCREREAELAHDDPSRCRSAGPTGGDVCGPSHCASFCALDSARCGNDAGAPYASEPACETACAKYAYPGDAGDGSQATGNTLNCRVYHLEKAYEADASASECANTAESSPNLQFPCE